VVENRIGLLGLGGSGQQQAYPKQGGAAKSGKAHGEKRLEVERGSNHAPPARHPKP
jgi:hypothetical protein